MKLIWSQDVSAAPVAQLYHGNYQEVLRAVGAWLDARHFHLHRLHEFDGELVIEVQAGANGEDCDREVIRLDATSIDRLTSAAHNDRNRFGGS